MTVDRIAAARQTLEEFNSRDVDAFAARFASDAEWWPLRSDTEGPYRGPDGIRAYFHETEQIFEYLCARVDTIEEIDGIVLAHGRLEGRGKGSGARAEPTVHWVFEIDGDRVVWGRVFRDGSEALAAARGRA